MRVNSGDDEKRNNFLDPTVKEKEAARGESGEAVLDPKANRQSVEDNDGQRTTGMGSGERKSGEDGDRG